MRSTTSLKGAPIHLRSEQIFATSSRFSGFSQYICASITALSRAWVALGWACTQSARMANAFSGWFIHSSLVVSAVYVTSDGAWFQKSFLVSAITVTPAGMMMAYGMPGMIGSIQIGKGEMVICMGVPDVGPTITITADSITFHDPHCVRLCPTNPDRLYQQNHCGIYRLDRPDMRWRKIGDTMPPEVGEIGFPMVVHARDADTAWVFPMDGTSVWPRTSPDGRPAVYVTRDAGASWQRLDAGLPKAQAWWTVKRQAIFPEKLTLGAPVIASRATDQAPSAPITRS